MSSLSESLQKLGIEPSVQDVDRWFREEAGMKQIILGRSFNGRPLRAYQWIYPPPSDTQHKARNLLSSRKNLSPDRRRFENPMQKTVLFLSLVHGNEPLGLITHLHTARRIVEEIPGWMQQRRNMPEYPPIQIMFFPIVNVDAYHLNLKHGSGCRRTNLNTVSCTPLRQNAEPEVTTCPDIPNAGVDLNRNFPMDWNGTYTPHDDSPCARLLKGPRPFSEPETRAIRLLVMNINHTVVAAMSFHSRSGASRDQALLIHPYASLRPIAMMNPENARRFRQWSELMNHPQDLYATGTAIESIGYAAGGATIDWLYSQARTMAFVHESTTPCGQRWCSTSYQHSIASKAHSFALAGLRLVQLVVDAPRVERESRRFDLGRWFSPSSSSSSSSSATQQSWSVFLYAFSALTIWVAWNFRRSRLARFHGTPRVTSTSTAKTPIKRIILPEHEIDDV